jgi:X-Pro dipeptidyl-peptidase-like protein
MPAAPIIHRTDPAPLDDRADHAMVRMRDGMRLATDVYLPARTPAPVVLVRLPYDKCGRYTFMPALAASLLERGYGFVVQDVRGKFRQVPVQPGDDHDVDDAALARMLPRYIGPALDFFDAFLRDGSSAGIPRVRWHMGHGAWHESGAWPPLPPGRTGSTSTPPTGRPWTPAGAASSARLPPRPAGARGRTTRRTSSRRPSQTRSPTCTSRRTSARCKDAATSRRSRPIRSPAGSSWPGRCRVAPGHRLCLHLASSDFPLFLPLLGDDDPWRCVAGAAAGQTLAAGGSHPSFVSVHVLDGPA